MLIYITLFIIVASVMLVRSNKMLQSAEGEEDEGVRSALLKSARSFRISAYVMFTFAGAGVVFLLVLLNL